MSNYPRLAGVNYESMVDGDGVRAVIFLSGCGHHCLGCHNEAAQDKKYGVEITEELIDEIASEIAKRPFLSGITLSGGDPFYDPLKTLNFLMRLDSVLVAQYKTDLTKLSIWIYSGYTYNEICFLSGFDYNYMILLKRCDVLVDGRFVQEKADRTLKFRGSSNQRIIDIVKSLDADRIVLHEDNGDINE